MLECIHCKKKSAYWEDGTAWVLPPTHCPKCNAVMNKKDSRGKQTITTTYNCPACSYSLKDKISLRTRKEKPDLDYEADRIVFCLLDSKSLEEHRDAKRRYDGLIEIAEEHKKREADKELYDALASLKKLKIPELTPLLTPALEESEYKEFSLDKPEIGRNVTVGFSCLDSESNREDYESRKTLKKLVTRALSGTNWALTSEGISYRLGYLTGRLKAYESEEDMLALIKRTKITH